MNRTIQLTMMAAIAVLTLAATSGKAHAGVLFSDYFANDSTVDTSLWSWNHGNPRILNQHLLLESTPGNGCEVISHNTFTYGQVEIKTASYVWYEDTSIGFETWNPGHEGVLVTNGFLGCINDTLTTGTDLEYYVPIPNWSNYATSENVFRIVWLEPMYPNDPNSYATAILYINGQYSCQYSGPQVPRVPCFVRLNSSNDAYDNLHVGYVAVSSNNECMSAPSSPTGLTASSSL